MLCFLASNSLLQRRLLETGAVLDGCDRIQMQSITSLPHVSQAKADKFFLVPASKNGKAAPKPPKTAPITVQSADEAHTSLTESLIEWYLMRSADVIVTATKYKSGFPATAAIASLKPNQVVHNSEGGGQIDTRDLEAGRRFDLSNHVAEGDRGALDLAALISMSELEA